MLRLTVLLPCAAQGGQGKAKEDEGGKSKKGHGSGKNAVGNFLLERIFTVFEKRNDDVMSLRSVPLPAPSRVIGPGWLHPRLHGREFTRGLHTLCRGSNQARLRPPTCPQ